MREIGSGNPSGPDTSSAARCKVLIVEDHVEMAKLMARLLTVWGHDTLIAHDGPTALVLARSECPRVIIADIDLPEMDGYQLARELRRLPELKNCLLIALTGYSQEEDRRRAKQAGFDHHFSKPVDLKMLKQMLVDVASAPPK